MFFFSFCSIISNFSLSHLSFSLCHSHIQKHIYSLWFFLLSLFLYFLICFYSQISFLHNFILFLSTYHVQKWKWNTLLEKELVSGTNLFSYSYWNLVVKKRIFKSCQDILYFIQLYTLGPNKIMDRLSTQFLEWIKWEEITAIVLKYHLNNYSLFLGKSLNQDEENSWIKWTNFKCIIKLILTHVI